MGCNRVVNEKRNKEEERFEMRIKAREPCCTLILINYSTYNAPNANYSPAIEMLP